MSLTLAIILNVVFDVGMLGGLAFVMTRAAKLDPHRPAVSRQQLARLRTRRAAPVLERERARRRVAA
jgi:hypothetical protein